MRPYYEPHTEVLTQRPMDVDRFVKFNEPEDGPARRVLLLFEDRKGSEIHKRPYSALTVILFNDLFMSIQAEFLEQVTKLNDSGFEEETNETIGRHLSLRNFPLTFDQECVKKSPPLSSFVLASDGQNLIIPLENAKMNSGNIVLGVVVTGKQYLWRKIAAARALGKYEPTPFVSDASGDTYNDSYFKEPRIIESHPETVFTPIKDILDIGKKLFAQGDYRAAERKFRKAFHYCHEYYPNDLSPTDLQVFTELKIVSVLNLAMASLKNKNVQTTLEATDFALSMPELSNYPNYMAKVLYRRGYAYLIGGDDEKALENFSASLALVPDDGTKLTIERCKRQRDDRNRILRKAMKRAFDS